MNGIFGLMPLPWWGYVVWTLILTHITFASITIFLHRHQAHRALLLHPIASHFFRFWLWLTTGIVTKEWTAIHRKHHAKCETADDPHSPQFYGLKKVLLEGSELYRAEAKNEETLKKYGNGTPDDWIEHHLYAKHSLKGVALMLVINLILFGPIGLSIWGIQMLWSPLLAAGVVNGIGHHLGYRNADTPDTSHNILPWGILIVGEELHNNHHAFPDSAKLSLRPFEFDIGWLYIRLLSFVRLATVKRLSPQIKDSRCFVDEETIAFLRKDKGRVRYMYRKLLLRVVNTELLHAKGEVREHLLSVHHLLHKVSWKQDTLPDTCAHTAALLGTESLLPSLGKFAELLMHIQAPHKEVTTSPEREATLVTELDHWCTRMIREGPPRFAGFARMLIRSSLPKQYS
jgi:stearoyl-CoA desaturase (delta-9 desaturase)